MREFTGKRAPEKQAPALHIHHSCTLLQAIQLFEKQKVSGVTVATLALAHSYHCIPCSGKALIRW